MNKPTMTPAEQTAYFNGARAGVLAVRKEMKQLNIVPDTFTLVEVLAEALFAVYDAERR